MKYNYYWRKSGLKKPYGDNFLKLVDEYKPKKVLEIGVFCGVTSRNLCELLKKNNGNNFKFYGLDLFYRFYLGIIWCTCGKHSLPSGFSLFFLPVSLVLLEDILASL